MKDSYSQEQDSYSARSGDSVCVFVYRIKKRMMWRENATRTSVQMKSRI